ncbi:MAG: hypothetical protein H6522_05815 [Mycolicibacterium sp.]|nr:hypothetical protein [Mycolicibacterium sp.]
MLVVLTGVALYQTVTGNRRPAPEQPDAVQGRWTIDCADAIIGRRRGAGLPSDANLLTGVLPRAGVHRGRREDPAHRGPEPPLEGSGQGTA